MCIEPSCVEASSIEPSEKLNGRQAAIELARHFYDCGGDQEIVSGDNQDLVDALYRAYWPLMVEQQSSLNNYFHTPYRFGSESAVLSISDDMRDSRKFSHIWINEHRLKIVGFRIEDWGRLAKSFPLPGKKEFLEEGEWNFLMPPNVYLETSAGVFGLWILRFGVRREEPQQRAYFHDAVDKMARVIGTDPRLEVIPNPFFPGHRVHKHQFFHQAQSLKDISFFADLKTPEEKARLTEARRRAQAAQAALRTEKRTALVVEALRERPIGRPLKKDDLEFLMGRTGLSRGKVYEYLAKPEVEKLLIS